MTTSKMSDDEYDFDKLCRTCLSYSSDLQSIFEICASSTLPVQLDSLIMSITKVEINHDDGMPQKICNLCKTAVHQAYLYKLKCEESDSKLRKYFRKKVNNLNIKEELHDYGNLDLSLADDPFQPSIEVDVNILNDDRKESIKITTRHSKNVSESSECTVCLKSFDAKTLAKHMKSHSAFKCETCDRTFAKQNHLNLHMQTHLKKEYHCDQCDDIFSNKKSLKTHENAVHLSSRKRGRPAKQLKHNSTMHESAFCSGPNGEKYCECKLCDKSFNKISALHEHMDQHVNNIQTLANINFTEKLDLFEGLQFEATNQENEFLIRFVHDQLSNGQNGRFYQIVNSHAWELNLSDSETESESEMYNGVQKKFSMLHQCSKCDQSFDRTWKIFAHMKTDHPNDEFADKCAHCLRIYPNSVLLTKHLKRQCENAFKAFNCNSCGVRFMWKSSYDSHVEKMHATEVNKEKAKTFTCEICERTFFRAEHLERHKKIHIPAEKKFSCDLCKKKFNRKDNLKSHMRVHKEDKDKEDGDKHLCVYCGRSFSNSSNLIVHMRRHTGEKPYKCDLCDKGFPRSSDLQCHRRTHTGEKPCLCTICGKGFSRSNKLVRHMRIHTGIRPYKCTYCDRAFTQSNDLTLHIRRHTGDKPYVCGICGDRFIQGTALQTHRRLQGHFEENQPTPFASISVNNPNRYTNANRVNRIGTVGLNVDELIKQEKSTVNSGTTMHVVEPPSSSPTAQLNRSAAATAAYIPNGNPYLTIQNLDVTPMLAISHFQGYN
ncbi:hypothetical protein HA402_007527 [Bradysia odoriphaga]|nr:hypothetical protein HA402_007527 [Bradysia odoriphaga]